MPAFPGAPLDLRECDLQHPYYAPGAILKVIVLLLILALGSLEAGAQTYDANSKLGNGIVNAGGQWAGQVGAVGAAANRATADQLLSQSLQHEAQGFASVPPNFGLLSQALTEARQGIKADDQARNFAQTSLQALGVGNTAGNVDLSKYGTSQDQLRDLANNSSQYLPKVQSEMGKYGISVDHDAAVIKTPFGEYPMDPTPEQMAQAIEKGASYFGANASTLGDAVKTALANSQAVAQKALAQAQANAKAGGGSRNTASTVDSKDKQAVTKKTAGPLTQKESPLQATGKPGDKNFDISARQLALAKSRAEMGGKIGMMDNIGDARQSVFAIVHQQYERMRIDGRLIDPLDRLTGASR